MAAGPTTRQPIERTEDAARPASSGLGLPAHLWLKWTRPAALVARLDADPGRRASRAVLTNIISWAIGAGLLALAGWGFDVRAAGGLAAGIIGLPAVLASLIHLVSRGRTPGRADVVMLLGWALAFSALCGFVTVPPDTLGGGLVFGWLFGAVWCTARLNPAGPAVSVAIFSVSAMYGGGAPWSTIFGFLSALVVSAAAGPLYVVQLPLVWLLRAGLRLGVIDADTARRWQPTAWHEAIRAPIPGLEGLRADLGDPA